jgi:hypothetical protein
MQLPKLNSTRLEEQVARLEALVADQAGRLQALEGNRSNGQGAGPQRPKAQSRRELLKLAGAAVVGAAGVAGAGVLNAVPAAAADGNLLVLGAAASNREETVTTLFSDNATTTTALLALDGFAHTGSNRVDGLTILAQEGGVAGNFNAATFGTVGPDVFLSGGGRLVQRQNVGAGTAPNFTPAANALESIRGDDGSFWMSRATGGAPLGTLKTAWKRMNTVRVDSAAGDGTAFVPVRVINTDPAVGPVVGGITGPLNSGATYTWSIAGTNGIPADAVGIVGNITAVAYTSGGFLTMFPTGVARPTVSSVNFAQAGTVFAWGNHFTAGFGTGANAGKISIFVGLNAGTDTTHVIVDVFGFLQ